MRFWDRSNSKDRNCYDQQALSDEIPAALATLKTTDTAKMAGEHWLSEERLPLDMITTQTVRTWHAAAILVAAAGPPEDQ